MSRATSCHVSWQLGAHSTIQPVVTLQNNVTRLTQQDYVRLSCCRCTVNYAFAMDPPRPMVLDVLIRGQDPTKPTRYVVTVDLAASLCDVLNVQHFAEQLPLKSAETLESIAGAGEGHEPRHTTRDRHDKCVHPQRAACQGDPFSCPACACSVSPITQFDDGVQSGHAVYQRDRNAAAAEARHNRGEVAQEVVVRLDAKRAAFSS